MAISQPDPSNFRRWWKGDWWKGGSASKATDIPHITTRNWLSRFGNGICQNDHGGPLVTWVGGRETVVGVAVAFFVTKHMECKGPFLFRSVHFMRKGILCLIATKTRRDARDCAWKARRSGISMVETVVDWKHKESHSATTKKSRNSSQFIDVLKLPKNSSLYKSIWFHSSVREKEKEKLRNSFKRLNSRPSPNTKRTPTFKTQSISEEKHSLSIQNQSESKVKQSASFQKTSTSRQFLLTEKRSNLTEKQSTSREKQSTLNEKLYTITARQSFFNERPSLLTVKQSLIAVTQNSFTKKQSEPSEKQPAITEKQPTSRERQFTSNKKLYTITASQSLFNERSSLSTVKQSLLTVTQFSFTRKQSESSEKQSAMTEKQSTSRKR